MKIPSNEKFGWLFTAIFFAGFGYLLWNHFLDWAIPTALLAILFCLVTAFAPTFLEPLNRAWFGLSLFLGGIFSPIVLSVMFFVLIVPVALITRLFGRDALLIKRRQVSSYWVEKELIEPESFKNQF
jgi:Na+-translocating ferredoxin:NAD+ oxidoreductase RnfD subunit